MHAAQTFRVVSLLLSGLALGSSVAAGCGHAGAPSAPVHAPLPAPDGDGEKLTEGRLPADTQPLRYALTLEIVPQRATFNGKVVIDLALDRPRSTIYLHARGLHARDVRVVTPDAQPHMGTLQQVSERGLAAVKLGEPVGPGPVRLEITFDAPYVDGLKGLYRAKAQGLDYAFTQFEAIAAREAFPSFDEPRFKTPFDVTLRVPTDHVAIANTRELSSKPYSPELREVRFATTEKLPTYLLAFAVGPFDVVTAPDMPASAERDRLLPLRGVAVKGRGADLAYALRETPAMLQSLEHYFGIAYPYDKLDLIAVPDFAAGAMENAGAITYRDTLLLIRDDAPEGQKRAFAYVNAHELAHQWFGNLVTMPWWDDIWLNEASATWMGGRVIKELYPEMQSELSALGYVHYAMSVDSQQSARQIRQPILTDHDIGNAFDSITYSKGGAMLSMFERYVGPEKFRDGLRLYMQRHRFGNATASDLIAALSEASKRPLESAFVSFLEQPGVPLLETTLDCAGPAPKLTIKQSRYFPLGVSTARDKTWQIPFCARYAVGTEIKEQCSLLVKPEEQVALTATSCPSWVMPNAGATGYYRWSLSDKELDALLAAKHNLSAAEQMSFAINAHAALRSGTLQAARVLSVLETLGKTELRPVLEASIDGFNFVRETLLEPEHWPAYRARMKTLVGPLYVKHGLFPKLKQAVDGEAKLTRALLVRSMAFDAQDPALRADLLKLGRAQLGLGEDARLAQLPHELLETALMVAVQDGGVPVFDRAQEQLLAADDGMARTRLLNALSATKDPALGVRVLDLALDPRLRMNETIVPLSAQAARVETRDGAFEWVQQHLDTFLSRVSEHRGSRVISVFGSFCSEDKARAVEALFAPKAEQIAGAPRELKLALESIRICTAVRAAQHESAQGFFASPARKGTSSSASPRATR